VASESLDGNKNDTYRIEGVRNDWMSLYLIFLKIISSGHFFWHSDRQLLIVCNLKDGVDLYRGLDTPVHLSSKPIKVRWNQIRQSTFVQSGRLVATGTEDGHCVIWDPSTTKTVQNLSHHSGVLHYMNVRSGLKLKAF
jgi:WD40 repeat protein